MAVPAGAALLAATRYEIELLVAQLRLLHQQVKDCERRLTQRLKAAVAAEKAAGEKGGAPAGDVEILLSWPGLGVAPEAWPPGGSKIPPVLKPMDEQILAALFRALREGNVRYALFGGVALALHGLPRATKDVDLFLAADAGNAAAAVRALRRVFPDPALDEIAPTDLEEYGVVRYGVADYDFVIDLTQRLGEAFRFEDLEVEMVPYLGEQVPVATPRTLVRMKRETGRPIDQLDVARLRERFDLEDV